MWYSISIRGFEKEVQKGVLTKNEKEHNDRDQPVATTVLETLCSLIRNDERYTQEDECEANCDSVDDFAKLVLCLV